MRSAGWEGNFHKGFRDSRYRVCTALLADRKWEGKKVGVATVPGKQEVRQAKTGERDMALVQAEDFSSVLVVISTTRRKRTLEEAD